MVQIIEENRQPKFSEQLLSGLGQAASEAATGLPKFFGERMLQQRRSEAYKNMFGQDIGAFPEDVQKEMVKKMMSGKGGQPDFSTAASALDQMEALMNKGHVGMLGRFNPTSAARFERGQFEALEAAVLPILKSIFPRGMTEKEFMTVKKDYLPQVGDTESRIRGKIQGLRQIMTQQGGSMQGQGMGRTREMRDEQGNVYDIPEEMYEKAHAGGLR